MRVDQRTGLRVDPKVVVISRVLELPQFELDQAIKQEINDNPALELIEDDSEQINEDELTREITGESESASIDEEFDSYAPRVFEPDDSLNWTEFLAAPVSLHEHLLSQLMPVVEREMQPLARYIVECVSTTGYLEMPIEEIAHTSGYSLKQARKLLRQLQECEPAGVGAHDLRECLLLQLRDAEDEDSLIARLIISKFWSAVPIRRTAGIARKLGVSEEQVSAAFRRIVSLTPYPGETFHVSCLPSHKGSASAVSPDIIFKRDESGIRFEIRGCEASQLSLNSWYKERYRLGKQGSHKVSEEESKHVREYVGRAMNFIKALHQRKQTLRRIATRLAEREIAYIATGSPKFLHGDTRVNLAKSIGLHESTVSRATMGKFVQLANGDVVSFEQFFKPSLRVQTMIQDILQSENPNRPLSDREIADILKSRGVTVARRTVNKYREKCRTLSSHQRRTA